MSMFVCCGSSELVELVGMYLVESVLVEVKFLIVVEVVVVMCVFKMIVYCMVHGGDLLVVCVGWLFRVLEKVVYDYLCNVFIEVG